MKYAQEIYEEIKNWECEFNFDIEEIKVWRTKPFYVYLFGYFYSQRRFPKTLSPKWKESTFYQIGKDKVAYKMALEEKKILAKKRAKLLPSMPSFNAKRPLEKRAVAYGNLKKVMVDGLVFETNVVPSRTRKFCPEVGLNLTPDAMPGSYYYYLRQSKYVFAWPRVRTLKSTDFTQVLLGKADWPIELRDIYLCFDIEKIAKESITEYHLLNYMLKFKDTAYLTYKDWLKFKWLIDNKGTIYGVSLNKR